MRSPKAREPASAKGELSGANERLERKLNPQANRSPHHRQSEHLEDGALFPAFLGFGWQCKFCQPSLDGGFFMAFLDVIQFKVIKRREGN
jgi:hypothetical protein